MPRSCHPVVASIFCFQEPGPAVWGCVQQLGRHDDKEVVVM